jgi:hypothetical protein
MRALISLGLASAVLVVLASASIYGCTSGVSSTTGDGGFGSSGGGGGGGSDAASDGPNVFEAGSSDSGASCGTYSKKCTTVSDCTTVALGCFCGAQPVIGIAKSVAATASACEQTARAGCALGCPNAPGRTAEDNQNDIDGGTIKVLCDNAECHTVLQ